MTVEHLEDVRPSTLLFHLTKRLLYKDWRDAGEDPKLHLFGQLKRITKQWLDTCLVCKGGTYPALLLYEDLADMACNRITAGITTALQGERPIKALLDPYNPSGSTAHVRFPTSKPDRWDTSGPPPKNHVNWVVLDSQWEAELCRVVEAHPRVVAYTKNHNLGFEVPYRYGSEVRRYRPDFIVLVDDGHGPDDLLRLVVETKGYRREDAKDKKLTMDTYWVPGVNNLGTFGRWAFAELTDVYQMESDFEAKVAQEFEPDDRRIGAGSRAGELTWRSVRKPKPKAAKNVEALRHTDDKRLNIPTAEHQSVLEAEHVAREGDSISAQHRPRPAARVARQGLPGLERPRRPGAAALHPGEGAPQGADRRPAQGVEGDARRSRPDAQIDLFADFNGVAEGPTGPTSTSTTRTGPTG